MLINSFWSGEHGSVNTIAAAVPLRLTTENATGECDKYKYDLFEIIISFEFKWRNKKF